MATKKCSRCSVEFTCGAETSECWCREISLDEPALEQLKKKFEDCLCPKCLMEFGKNVK